LVYVLATAQNNVELNGRFEWGYQALGNRGRLLEYFNTSIQQFFITDDY
jgi:hypothetical protein